MPTPEDPLDPPPQPPYPISMKMDFEGPVKLGGGGDLDLDFHSLGVSACLLGGPGGRTGQDRMETS